MGVQDYGYKELFSHREMVYDLISHFFNEKWFKGIDIESLEKVNSHYISVKYEKRESDIVWKMKYKGEWIYLYLLLEFQSTIDRYMSIRLMSYIGLLYEDLIKSKVLTKKRELPPVLPWVIYTGRQAWSAPLHSHLLLEKAAPLEMKEYFPQFKYHILDIGHYPLLEGQGTNLITALIKLEKTILDRNQSRPIIEALLMKLKGSEYDSLRRAFARYAHRILKLRNVAEETDIEKIDLEEVRNMLAERIEAYDRRLVEEGRQEASIAIACKLLDEGFDPLVVSKATSMPIEKVNNLNETLLDK